MILRLRARVLLHLSWMLLLAGVAMAAPTAAEPVSAEVRYWVYERLAAAALLVIGAHWALLRYFVGAVAKSTDTVAASVRDLAAFVATHRTDPYAHGPVTDRTHEPILTALAELESGQAALAHSIADLTRRESALCDQFGQLRESLGHGRRRASDPVGVDVEALRGRP